MPRSTLSQEKQFIHLSSSVFTASYHSFCNSPWMIWTGVRPTEFSPCNAQRDRVVLLCKPSDVFLHVHLCVMHTGQDVNSTAGSHVKLDLQGVLIALPYPGGILQYQGTRLDCIHVGGNPRMIRGGWCNPEWFSRAVKCSKKNNRLIKSTAYNI